MSLAESTPVMKGREGRAKRILPPLFFMLALLCFFPCFSSAGEDPLDGSLARAKAEKLWEAPYWRTLGHYERSGAGWKSLVDDPAFFLAPNGKTDPEAELCATLSALFTPGSNAACRFPARMEWLAHQLGIDPSSLPQKDCPEFERLYRELAPRGAFLVFASSTMGRPASMFGHTLIGIRTRQNRRLLSQAINYAAVIPEGVVGPVYFFKGFTGGFSGFHSMRPYYEKLEEYRDVHHRDLFEYELNIGPTELRRLLLHAWELRGIRQDYYFLDENCSFSLLFLLDAARPGLNLAGRTGFPVFPKETVNLCMEAGLLAPPVFVASKKTRIEDMARGMESSQVRAARAISLGNLPPEDAPGGREEKIPTLDLASELIAYRYTAREIPKEEYIPLFRKTLSARSALGAAPAPVSEPPSPIPPDQAHKPRRLTVHMGVREQKPFVGLGLRAGYHALSDPQAGYDPGAEIVFGNVEARYYPDDGKAKLHRLDLLEARSLDRRDALFSPISWRLYVGFSPTVMPDRKEEAVSTLAGGMGMAWDAGPLGRVYGLVEARASYDGGLVDNYAFGPAARAGLCRNLSQGLRFTAEARVLRTLLGDRFTSVEGEAGLTISLGKNQSLFFGGRAKNARGEPSAEVSLGLGMFF